MNTEAPPEKTFLETQIFQTTLLVTNRRIVANSTTIPLEQVTKVETTSERKTDSPGGIAPPLMGVASVIVGIYAHSVTKWPGWLVLGWTCGIILLWKSVTYLVKDEFLPDHRPPSGHLTEYLVIHTAAGAEKIVTVPSLDRWCKAEHQSIQHHKEYIDKLDEAAKAISEALGQRGC
jgi:hypothetical protein